MITRGFLAAALVFVCLAVTGWVGAQAPAPAQASQLYGPSWQNPVKKALKEGKVVIGATIVTASPDAAATLGAAGFDFLWIEGEHSPVSLETTRNMILATRGLRAVPFTRVPVNETWLAKRVLDIGSLGVMFPFTSTRELAQQAVAACKYPPQGVRGFGPGLASSRWNIPGGEYPKWANENVMVIVIVEQKEAIANIEEIASVPGIDVLFIGANDLSFSMGVPGQLNHPTMQEAVAKVVAAGKKNNLALGYPAGNPDQIKKLVEQGFRFFQASNEVGFMQAGARQLLNGVQGAVGDKLPTSIY